MKAVIAASISLLLAVFALGISLGLAISQDTYNIPTPPTIDIACVPATYIPTDPCQEDEVLWWIADDVRSCVALDELCVDVVEAYK